MRGSRVGTYSPPSGAKPCRMASLKRDHRRAAPRTDVFQFGHQAFTTLAP